MTVASELASPKLGAGLNAALLRKNSWRYVTFVFALWVMVPELRRLIDWKIGYSSIATISVLPLLALVPVSLALLYSGDVARLKKPLAFFAWFWFGAFLYAFGIGVAAGNALPALYTLLQFCLPLSFALWLSTLDLSTSALYERISGSLLWLSTPVCLYAIFQFATAPPWDVAWMLATRLGSVGLPAPFEIRPFGTLNSPAPFADFLVAVVVLNAPRLGSPIRIGQVALALSTLALTLERSAWIAFAVATLCYVLFTPSRIRNLTLFGGAVAVAAVLILHSSSLLGSAHVGIDLQRRFETLTNLDSDFSFNQRLKYLGTPLDAAFAQPIGEGLGDVGTAAKLGSMGTTVDFDSGFIARFIEMGYFGIACYLGVLIAAMLFSYRRWLQFNERGMRDAAAVAAACLALQAALLVLDASSDHHSGFMGILFWSSLALLARGNVWKSSTPAQPVP